MHIKVKSEINKEIWLKFLPIGVYTRKKRWKNKIHTLKTRLESLNKRTSKYFSLILMTLLLCVGCTGKPAYGEAELLESCYSPDSNIELRIYQGPPADAVMVDFYVVGEIKFQKEGNLKEHAEEDVIYYKYHEEYENAYWLDNEHVVINGCEIDITDQKTWIQDLE